MVAKLGKSSITYRIGIFVKGKQGSCDIRSSHACAVIDFVHVYVDAKTRKTTPMPEAARKSLERILRLDEEKSRL